MKSYFVKTPWFVKRLYPNRIWSFPKHLKTVYLTFDDGPNPEVSPWVLGLLNNHQAKATFFCIGDNIKKYPTVFEELISEGHAIGNHTYNHLNGWKTPTSKYVYNVLKNEVYITSKFRIQNSELLFRPPFGKLTSKQSKILQEKGYKIIMWDILCGDFDKQITKEKCLENIVTNIKPGSIVVFHDSLKSEVKLKYVLPKVLDYLNKKGFESKSIVC